MKRFFQAFQETLVDTFLHFVDLLLAHSLLCRLRSDTRGFLLIACCWLGAVQLGKKQRLGCTCEPV